MIGRIQGILLQKNPPQLLVDCQGVGYEIDVPMSTFYNLPAVGEKVTLFTHLAIREDAHVLYGFGSLDERALFRQLIRISGVGARTALALLSGLSVNDMSQAVALQDASRLTSIPGIGKKTAERLLLELKGKLENRCPVCHFQQRPERCNGRHSKRLACAGLFRERNDTGNQTGTKRL